MPAELKECLDIRRQKLKYKLFFLVEMYIFGSYMHTFLADL